MALMARSQTKPMGAPSAQRSRLAAASRLSPPGARLRPNSLQVFESDPKDSPQLGLCKSDSGLLSPQTGSILRSDSGKLAATTRAIRRPTIGSNAGDDYSALQRGTALAAAAFRQLRGDVVGQEAAAPGGRGWQILRRHWEDFVRKRETVPATVAASLHGIVRPPRGPSRPEMRKELFEGIVDKLTHPVGDESPEEKERIARWTRAKTLHAEVKGLRSQLAQLTGTGSPRPQPLGSEAPAAAGGAEACTAASAAEAFFPAGWREALSIELLADLVIDAWLPSFADSVVEELAATVEDERRPPPPPPLPRKLGGSRSAPGFPALEKRRAVMPLPRLAQQQPPGGDHPATPSDRGGSSQPSRGAARRESPRQCLRSISTSRRLLSPVNDRLRMPSEGFATSTGGAGGAGHDPWARHPYFMSLQGAKGYRDQILQDAAAQRPRQRLQRRQEAVGDPKFVAPMTASHFPEEWERVTRKRPEVQPSLLRERSGQVGFGAAADKEQWAGSKDVRALGRARVEKRDGIEETDDMNPTWLIKSDALGRSIFPYSLAAHRAFIDSQPEEWLREKAREAAPMQLTTWS